MTNNAPPLLHLQNMCGGDIPCYICFASVLKTFFDVYLLASIVIKYSARIQAIRVLWDRYRRV